MHAEDGDDGERKAAPLERLVRDTRTQEQMMADYREFRGKCKQLAEAAIAKDPTLTLVRGHYCCPSWGMQPHWWTVRQDGTVYDPAARQFPSEGNGVYFPFDGLFECANCGKEMNEDDASFEGNYAFCSYECHGRFIGVL